MGLSFPRIPTPRCLELPRAGAAPGLFRPCISTSRFPVPKRMDWESAKSFWVRPCCPTKPSGSTVPGGERRGGGPAGFPKAEPGKGIMESRNVPAHKDHRTLTPGPAQDSPPNPTKSGILERFFKKERIFLLLLKAQLSSRFSE